MLGTNDKTYITTKYRPISHSDDRESRGRARVYTRKVTCSRERVKIGRRNNTYIYKTREKEAGSEKGGNCILPFPYTMLIPVACTCSFVCSRDILVHIVVGLLDDNV